MCDFKSIRKALQLLCKNGQDKKITLLHCNTAYPTPLNDVNILTMNKLKKFLKFLLVTRIML